MIPQLPGRAHTAMVLATNAIALLLTLGFGGYISRAAQPSRLAIIGFVSSADDSRWQKENRSLIDLLTGLTSKESGYDLVERVEMDKVFQEQGLIVFQAPDLKNAIRLGGLLRADLILFGSIIGGANTNVLVAQLVDVRSGIIRSVVFLPVGKTGLPALAEPLAGFVRRAAVPGKPDSFLAVGTFEDMSVRTAFPNYGPQLRAGLIQKLGGTNVSLVERSMVNPILNELRLGMIGSGLKTNEMKSAQPAFVLLDGLYQTIPGEPPKLNLVLRAERLGEGIRTYSFSRPADEELTTAILATVRRILEEPLRIEATRQEEAQVQLRRGKEQARVRRPPGMLVRAGNVDEDQRRVTLSEGIKSLENAVFLDPDCDEAKAYLGFCLMDPAMNRAEEGRSYLLEVRAATTNGELYRLAGALLAEEKHENDPLGALQIYEAGHAAATSTILRAQESEKMIPLYRRMLQLGQFTPDEHRARILQLWRGDLTNAARSSVETKLYVDGVIDKMFRALTETFADDAVANSYLEKKIPELESAAPLMAPYLVAGWLRSMGTNSSPELRKRFDQSIGNIGKGARQDFSSESLLF